MNQEKLLNAKDFPILSLDTPSGWMGHILFGAWLINETRPSRFVELGTHYGHSYFNLCQSVKLSSQKTECFAVDTWAGDEHAGHYDDSIFTKVDSFNKDHFDGFSTLIRSTFDDAASRFESQSIDLLHIDGLHTYEAVSNDFNTWLPKLSPGAIVMLHDTHVYERDFGVHTLWEELKKVYDNHIEFSHSYGLGALQIPPEKEGAKSLAWLEPGSKENKMVQTWFSTLGSHQQESADYNRRINELSKENTALRNSFSWRITRPLRLFKSALIR